MIKRAFILAGGILLLYFSIAAPAVMMALDNIEKRAEYVYPKF